MNVTVICPHCQQANPQDAKFCGSCGTLVRKEGAVAPLTMGDKNIVGGDVVANKSEIRVLGGSYTAISHSDESQKVLKCTVSHQHDVITNFRTCPVCGGDVLKQYFDEDTKACHNCRDKIVSRNESQYKAKVVDLARLGVISKAHRDELNDFARAHRIADARTSELEAEVQNQSYSAEGRKLSRISTLRLAEAQELLTGYRLQQAFQILEDLRSGHSSEDSDLNRTYLYCLADQDPTRAWSEIQSLRYDDSDLARIRVELLTRKGDLDAATREIEKAKRIHIEHSALWAALEANVALENYKLRANPIYLEYSEEALSRGSDSEAAANVRAKLEWLKGDRNAFRSPGKATPSGWVDKFSRLQLEKYVTAGRLKVITGNGIEHPCASGAIIGREGDVARSHFLRYPTVSRKHCEVLLRAGGWHLRIIASTNATYVNDVIVSEDSFVAIPFGRTKVRISSQCEIEILNEAFAL
jgi:hypothetical protein